MQTTFHNINDDLSIFFPAYNVFKLLFDKREMIQTALIAKYKP